VDALNTLRAVLVGLAFVAAVILSFDGQWVPAAVMFLGIAAHFGLWGYLRAQKRRDAADSTTIDGIPAAER
jgi:CHASE2 domain-containing sensor protein